MKLLIAVLCLVAAQTSSFDLRKLLLTVYYESKCPDSRKFIEEQLLPTMSHMQQNLHLKLVPFGKAKSINQGISGFQCQHGPTECLGNIVQDCAIDVMTRGGRSNMDIVNYVNCEMKTLAGTVGNLQCVQNAYLPVQMVQQCVNSSRGIELQLQSEYLTNIVSPQFIPTVTINGYFDQQIQNQAQDHLYATLCQIMPGIEPCSQNYLQNRHLTKVSNKLFV